MQIDICKGCMGDDTENRQHKICRSALVGHIVRVCVFEIFEFFEFLKFGGQAVLIS